MSDLEPRPEPLPLPRPPAGPADLRASDADRDRVAEVLRVAAGDGRLTLGELDERLEAAFTAKTYGELERLTADLPRSGAVGLTPPAASETVHAVFGSEKRTGRWEIPERMTAQAIVGDVELDLSEAVARHAEVFITARAVMGEVTIIVPDGVAVQMETGGSVVLGERTCKVPAPSGIPTLLLRVRADAWLGEVTVRPPKQPRRWLRGGRREVGPGG